MGPRTRLDVVEKITFLTLAGPELWSLRHPARRQPLYRLRYPSLKNSLINVKNLRILNEVTYFIRCPQHMNNSIGSGSSLQPRNLV
jgi:hypothetical protein